MNRAPAANLNRQITSYTAIFNVMRAMPINADCAESGLAHIKRSFKKNWIHYLQEAFGLALFMASACFFGALLWGRDANFHLVVSSNILRSILTGFLMGLTALFIFYSPLTSPSGSHINPAVTLTFLRLKKIDKWDALFYIVFQIMGGTAAVYVMALLLQAPLTKPPVNYLVTVPSDVGEWNACIMEFLIGFLMMLMVLITSSCEQWKKYTRMAGAMLVCIYVVVAGPVSGFGMNPARSLASAIPANTWTAFWIYLIIPFASMLSAAEVFLFATRRMSFLQNKKLK